MKVLLVLAVLAGAAQAQAPASECRPVVGTGCVYVPAGAKGEAGLLVYMRGWASRGGKVPPVERLEGARSAFTGRHLRDIADGAGLAVLVTGGSDAVVGEAELQAAERAAGLRFPSLIVAAHSGAYVGLGASLPFSRRVTRLIMLDDFYFDDPMTPPLKALVDAGAVCTGFYTPHNEERWRARFRPFVACPVDRLPDAEHSTGVERCLAAYLKKTTCL